MKIAFCADPLDGFKTYKDSTYAMMVEAARRGHAVFAFEQKDMAIDAGRVVANARHIRITDDTGTQAAWYRAEGVAPLLLRDFDAIIMRKDPPFDMEYIYAT